MNPPVFCLENLRDGERAAIYGSYRVGHDLDDLAASVAATIEDELSLEQRILLKFMCRLEFS